MDFEGQPHHSDEDAPHTEDEPLNYDNVAEHYDSEVSNTDSDGYESIGSNVEEEERGHFDQQLDDGERQLEDGRTMNVITDEHKIGFQRERLQDLQTILPTIRRNWREKRNVAAQRVSLEGQLQQVRTEVGTRIKEFFKPKNLEDEEKEEEFKTLIRNLTEQDMQYKK